MPHLPSAPLGSHERGNSRYEIYGSDIRELYQDAKNLLEKKLPLGDERWKDTANLANDFADASHMLIKFLAGERKQIAKEKMEEILRREGSGEGEFINSR